MSDEVNEHQHAGAVLRYEPDTFDTLRDAVAAHLGVDPGAIEKDYWATEVLPHPGP